MLELFGIVDRRASQKSPKVAARRNHPPAVPAVPQLAHISLLMVKVVAISCRESFASVDVPRCVSRLSSPLAPEATRDRQTASKDALDVLVTGASLLTGTSSAVCGARHPGDCAATADGVVAQMAL